VAWPLAQLDNQDWLALLGVPRAKEEAKCLLQRQFRSVCPIGRHLQLQSIYSITTIGLRTGVSWTLSCSRCAAHTALHLSPVWHCSQR